MLIRFLVVSVIKHKIMVETVFCSYACDSEAESVLLGCVSPSPALARTGLVGEKCSQKVRGSHGR